MQLNAIAGGDLPHSGVRGLGVSDVLEVALDASQLPWLIEALEARRRRVEEQLREAAADGLTSNSSDGATLVEERQYELRLLRMMQACLPGCAHHGRVVLVGPSGMVEDAIREAVRRVADSLSELASGSLRGEDACARLQETTAAAAAWVETLLNCQAVVAFNFDPGANPGAAW
jgi:hypothetical protein